MKQIEWLASRDDLTGVFNRRNFMQTLETQMRRAKRSPRPLCLAMLDLDHFKVANYKHGHAVGDMVLKVFCRIIERSLGSSAKFGLFGGEDFGALLPETSQ